MTGLESHINKPIIPAETTHEPPTHPYIAIKSTTQAIGIGQAAVFTNKEDATQTILQDYERVISLTVHAATIADAEDIAQSARNYFISKGAIDLSLEHITVVDVLPSTNRDVFLNIEYERRVGFDVRLRYRDIEKYSINVIEEIEIGGE